MSGKLELFTLHSSSRHSPPLFWAALLAMALHIGLLGIGNYWHPVPPKPKEKQKVIVQTIALAPSKTAQTRISAPLPPTAPTSTPLPPQPATEVPKPAEKPPEEISIQEEIAPRPEPIVEKEIAPIAPPPPTPKPNPPPVKKSNPPQTKQAPKPTVNKEPKPVEKKSAPVKKQAETVKKPPKPEASKPKVNPEAEKKKQQEKAEAEKKKQREKEEADKKRQKEQAEAEIKRQNEIAAEKKRQQEIAAAEEAARQKERALLSKAKENLAKMGETRDKISSSPSINLDATALPKELGTLQVDALPVAGAGGAEDWGTKEVSYSGEVAARLKKALRLPDYGAVKIHLTLDRTGKVVKVEIVQSESSKNKAYVESKIPTLLFPPFGQRFKDASQNTFVITLQNDT